MLINGMSPLSNHKGYPKRLTIGFIAIALVASVVSVLLLADRFRSYRADIDMLVLSKSEQGALEVEAVRDALQLLGGTPGFLYGVNETTDVSRIEFSETGKSSFRMSVISDTPIDARDGAIKASQDLFSLVGRYYDIRNNISVRSIDAPHGEAFIAYPVVLIASGVATGVIFSGAFFLVVLSIARMAFSFRKEESVSTSKPIFFSEKNEGLESVENPYVFSPDAFVPKKVDAKFFSFESSGIEREKDYAHFNRGPAPINLPIAEDGMEAIPQFMSLENLSENQGFESDEETGIFPEIEPMIDDAPADTPPLNREPTEEEYKQRLNDLLKGKMLK